MSKSKHVVSWFEIPVSDIARAARFYSEVLGIEMSQLEFGPIKMALFPGGDGEGEDVVHGALAQGEGYVPGATGPLLYLNAGDDLALPLGRVEAAGGAILMDKRSISPHGFMAIFRDTEGNRIAFHSPN